MRIALDAMGGDKAPGPIVAGGLRAVAEDASMELVLVGDGGRLAEYLPDSSLPERVEIFQASQSIDMSESPVEGLRRKPDNSIARCWQLLAEKKVDAVVSAGNTGAMVAGGLRLNRFLPNVKRPGIGALMPTEKGLSLVIDVGANVTPKPINLYQYGAMGAIFAKHMLGRDAPTVGLLNIGEEAGKGHELAKATHDLFRASPLTNSFVGNVEGRDIHRGACDVVITEGFVGNVVLKLSEGVFEFVMKAVTPAVMAASGDSGAAVKQALGKLIDQYHHSGFGGAPLLGIDGICIICHGSSDDRSIFNALKMAAKFAAARLNELIVRDLEFAPEG